MTDKPQTDNRTILYPYFFRKNAKLLDFSRGFTCRLPINRKRIIEYGNDKLYLFTRLIDKKISRAYARAQYYLWYLYETSTLLSHIRMFEKTQILDVKPAVNCTKKNAKLCFALRSFLVLPTRIELIIVP